MHPFSLIPFATNICSLTFSFLCLLRLGCCFILLCSKHLSHSIPSFLDLSPFLPPSFSHLIIWSNPLHPSIHSTNCRPSGNAQATHDEQHGIGRRGIHSGRVAGIRSGIQDVRQGWKWNYEHQRVNLSRIYYLHHQLFFRLGVAMRTLGLNPTEVHTLQFLLIWWKLHTIGENMHSLRKECDGNSSSVTISAK